MQKSTIIFARFSLPDVVANLEWQVLDTSLFRPGIAAIKPIRRFRARGASLPREVGVWYERPAFRYRLATSHSLRRLLRSANCRVRRMCDRREAPNISESTFGREDTRAIVSNWKLGPEKRSILLLFPAWNHRRRLGIAYLNQGTNLEHKSGKSGSNADASSPSSSRAGLELA